WSDEDLGSPWRGPALGDFDGDGVTEAVAATQGTMYGGGTRLLAFDTAAHTLEAMSEPFQDEASFAGTQDLEVTDADGDGVDELLLTRWDGASAIWQRFGLTRIGEFIELSAGAVAAPELSPQAVAAVDLGLDGTPEILMGVSVLPPGRHGLAAFDLHGRLTGARTLGDDPVIELRQADLDHDGDPELVTLTSRALTAFDLRTMTPIASLTGQLPGHFIAMDVTPDGRVLTAEGLQEVGVYELGRRGLRSVARWHIRDELRSVRAAGADRVLLIGRWVGPFSRGSLSVHETLSGRSLWETSHDHDANDGQWLAVEPSTGELWSAGASSVYAWALP
ncbi:MAG TPA: hypothetical protein PKA64_19725, partial [Myxococcota bacterium]|nr:hypothetical protein [Myxococcota bacterium]